MAPQIARMFAENMPSGYSLLPSPKYFSRVLDPVVEFDPASALAAEYRNHYGLTINELIGILIGFIKTMNLSENREGQLLRKVGQLAKSFSADYFVKQRTDQAFKNLIRSIDLFRQKNLLTSAEAIELKTLIGLIGGEVVE